MASAGAAAPALATAAIGSFVAGTIGDPAADLPAPSRWRTSPCSFGPADYFALTVLAFVVGRRAASARSLIRGMLALFLGLVHRPRRASTS